MGLVCLVGILAGKITVHFGSYLIKVRVRKYNVYMFYKGIIRKYKRSLCHIWAPFLLLFFIEGKGPR